MALLEPGRFKSCPTLGGPNVVRDYLRVTLMAEPNEVFVVVFLNSQHQVLACEPLFKGTVSEASVYPRVVVQRALELNASADRKSVVSGKSVSVRVDLGGCRIINKKKDVSCIYIS